MNFKNVALYFVLLSVLFFACKKDKQQPEPADGGEIIFDNTARATLDTASIILYENPAGTKKYLIFDLYGNFNKSKTSLLLVSYEVPLGSREIPEGQFVLKGDDFFHYSVRNDTSASGGHQRQLTFNLRKTGELRYSVEFNGIAKGKPISGRYSGYWSKMSP